MSKVPHGHPARAVLDAGGIVPADTLTGDDVDALTIRTYTHPVLDDRPVVQLVPGTLGEAEDLALGFLGLTRDGDAPVVGQIRREALGFPAWALVNDPANGHHALALVRDIERLDRQAKTRPGAAKDGFDELGRRLGRAVPHFLPTFHEQAARIFLAHDNPTYASMFFGKAREAERVHNLAVEEERLRAVFLEFAFAGALTAKALKEYAKALTVRLGPKQAWVQFRQLAVERCTAGMPPYAGLAEDARSMIKAAGGDVAEERGLLRDLLATPAITRAPASFWKVNRKPLAGLAETEPATRLRLIELLPRPDSSSGAQEIDAMWLDLLDECGVLDLLVGGDLEPGVRAGWLADWTAHRRRGGRNVARCTRTLALVAAMAPALRAEGTPVRLFVENHARSVVEADLLDLALAEGIPVADPGDGARIDLAQWWQDEAEGRRDLVAVVADPRLSMLLDTAVDNLGDGQHAARRRSTAAHPALRPVLRRWLLRQGDVFGASAGLPATDSALSALYRFGDIVADVVPEVVERVRTFDVSPLLAKTLRAGLYDELGWPALDEAIERFATDGDKVRCDEAWPALVLSSDKRAVVIGPEGILLEHEPRLPKGHRTWQRTHYRYVDGQLLVAWYNKDYDWEAYWSAHPDDTFLLTGAGRSDNDDNNDGISLALPDGGVTTGHRPVFAGDTTLPPRRTILTDGVGHWILRRDPGRDNWVEYDPSDGTQGRVSLPAPLAAAVTDGGTLVQAQCELLPLVTGFERTPFGTDGTHLGRWVRVDGDTITTGSVDGTTVTIRRGADRNWNNLPGTVPLGALRVPGAAPIVLAQDTHITLSDEFGTALGSFATHTRGEGPAAGSRFVPPRAFWHALRPRDETGSHVLRAITPEQAVDLVTAVQADHDRAVGEYKLARAERERTHPDGNHPETLHRPAMVRTEPVRALLPDVTDPVLVGGVAWMVRETARIAERLRDFGKIAEQGPAEPAPTGPAHGRDRDFADVVSDISGMGYLGHRHQGWGVFDHIAAVAAAFTTAPEAGAWTYDKARVPVPGFQWHPLLARRGDLLARALSPFLPDERRASLLVLLEALAAGPLGNPDGVLRTVVLCEPTPTHNSHRNRIGQVLRLRERTVIILEHAYHYGSDKTHWLALDHDPSGRFEAIHTFNSHKEHRYTEPTTPRRCAAAVAAIREHGPVPWAPEAVPALVEATGLGRAEATLLLAGLHGDTFTKEQRAQLGLKVVEADTARAQLHHLDDDARGRVLAAFVPEDVADVADPWSKGLDLAAIGRAWTAAFGRVLRLPEDIAADVPSGLRRGIETILEPEKHPWLTDTSKHRLDDKGNLVTESGQHPASNSLFQTVGALTWLAYRLPYGHPLRPQLPHVLDLLRTRVADPGLIVDLDVEYAGGHPSAPRVREAAQLAETGGAGPDGLVHVDDRFVLTPWYNGREFTYVRPAGFTDADDPWFERLTALRGGVRSAGFDALRRILDPEFEKLLSADGPVGEALDPTYSVPELVAEVAETHGIGQDAASLYLQVLALPDPTDRRVAQRTGWKPARLKKARAELAGTDLVVEAIRPRAGRSLFLPGGWHALKTPALPLEIWKDGLYTQKFDNPIVPDLPAADLYRRAWQRVQDGDAPGFEQLVTRTRRKGRR